MSAVYSMLFNFARNTYDAQRIAICPFHENGALLKQILNDSFGVREEIIIDNGLSKYNPGIKSVAGLNDMDTSGLTVLLNSTNPRTNAELAEELKEVNHEIMIHNILEPIYVHKPEKAAYLKTIKELLTVRKCVGENLIRVGGLADGGYVMLDDFEPDMKSYSFGIGNEISYDLQIASMGIKNYMYDPTINALPGKHPNFEFFMEGIAGGDIEAKKLYSMNTFLQRNGDLNNKKLILKMDVEGTEWDFINNCPEKLLDNFTQMTFEFHNVTNRNRADEIIGALSKLNRTHQVIWIHGNVAERAEYAGEAIVPNLLEVTFASRKKYTFVDESFVSPMEDMDSPNVGKTDFKLGEWGAV